MSAPRPDFSCNPGGVGGVCCAVNIPHPRRRRRLLALAAVALAGCNPHVRRDATEAPVVVPAAFAAEGEAAAAPAAPRWWTAFGDAALDANLERLLAANLDLRQGWARVRQARVRATQAGSARWPTLDASLDVSRSKQISSFSLPGRDPSTEITSWRASLAASYEVDLFGRIEAQAEAAEADVDAAVLDQRALGMSLAASLVEAWYGVVEQRALRRLLDDQVALNQRQLELLQFRFAQGLAGSVDLLQQEDQIQRLESQIPLVEARQVVLENQIAVLLGEAPGAVTLAAPDVIPDPPPLPATGLPAAVLGQRPDVQAAQARIRAADARVGVAVAQRYPALRLQASVGLQAFDLEKLLDDWVWSIAGSLVAPLFDGGRREAEVEVARAEVEARVLALGKVMLTALREVQDALVQEARQRAHLATLEGRLALLRQLLQDAQARYLEGVTDYLPVISALGAVQQVEQAVLAARRQLLSLRIQLHRALGGDWSDLVRPGDGGKAS
ncbi:MAG: efflux transporter outer membrane subunit [Myxococcales bacterium]|nr:efflux transporter outer membrane subunit [Myxococcales bacterium]